MKYEKYLPIGTVVLLKEAKKKLMITGFYVKSPDNEKTFDYSACVYPEGVLDSRKNLLFDHDEIQDIFYLGYVSDEEKEFKAKLNDVIKKVESGEIQLPENNS